MDIEVLRNLNIEQEVLGAILMDNSLLGDVIALPTEVFYSNEHKELFKVMKTINNKGLNVDNITIMDHVIKNNLSEKIKLSYIANLASSVPTTVMFSSHLNILKDYYIKRRFKSVVQNLDFSEDGRVLVEKTLSELEKFIKDNIQQQEESFEDFSSRYIDELFTEETQGLKTGLINFDGYLGGFRNGELITIAAYTGIGKTTLASQIILNMILKNYGVSLFTLEVPKKDLMDKFVSNLTSIEYSRVRKKDLVDKEKEKIIHSIAEKIAMKKLNIYEAKSDIDYICSTIRMDKLKNNIDIAFIDLINRVTSKERHGTRADHLGAMTRRLKLLAIELEIPIVITAQINRSVEHRDDARPTLADIKESGGISEDSDIVLGLYRNKKLEEKKYREQLHDAGKLNYSSKDAEINPDVLEVALLKARFAEFKRFAFRWKPQFQSVENILN